MNEELLQALRDFVATSNSGKYKTEEELISKFPELQDYETSVLKDFVATSNSGKYKSEEELISKFPEFDISTSQKKKDVQSEPTSQEPVSDLEQKTQVNPDQDGMSVTSEPQIDVEPEQIVQPDKLKPTTKDSFDSKEIASQIEVSSEQATEIEQSALQRLETFKNTKGDKFFEGENVGKGFKSKLLQAADYLSLTEFLGGGFTKTREEEFPDVVNAYKSAEKDLEDKKIPKDSPEYTEQLEILTKENLVNEKLFSAREEKAKSLLEDMPEKEKNKIVDYTGNQWLDKNKELKNQVAEIEILSKDFDKDFNSIVKLDEEYNALKARKKELEKGLEDDKFESTSKEELETLQSQYFNIINRLNEIQNVASKKQPELQKRREFLLNKIEKQTELSKDVLSDAELLNLVKKNYGALDNLRSKIAVGTSRLVQMPEALTLTGIDLQKLVLSALPEDSKTRIGGEIGLAIIEEKLSKRLLDNIKDTKKVQEMYEKPMSIKDVQDISDLFYVGGSAIADNAISLMSAAATGPAAPYVFYAIGASDKRAEIEERKSEDKNFNPTPFQSWTASQIAGGAESAFGLFGTIKNVRAAKQTVSGKGSINKYLDIKGYSKNAGKDILSGGKNEIREELGVLAVDGINNHMILGDEDSFKNMKDQTADVIFSSGFVGSATRMAPHTVGMLGRIYGSSKARKQIREINETIETLSQNLMNKNLDDDKRQMITDEITKLTSQNQDFIESDLLKLNNISKEDKKRIADIYFQTKEIRKKAQDLASDPNINKGSKQKLLAKFKAEAENLLSEKETILEKAEQTDIPENKLNSFKDQALNELIAEKEKAGETEYEITDEEITQRAIEISERSEDKSETKTTTETETQPETTETPAVEEINNLPLTRIEGLKMGASQAEGTYVSTEKAGNRYQKSNPDAKVSQVSANIKNPLVVTDDTGLVDMRNTMLNENKDQFTAEDFEMVEVPNSETLTIDDLNDTGIAKLAKMVTKSLKDQGYDSIYFPESKNQEGELVVFDRKNVTQLKPKEDGQKEKVQDQKDEQAEKQTEEQEVLNPEVQSFANELSDQQEDLSDISKGSLQVQVGDTKITLNQKDKNIIVESVATPDNQRGKGNARKAMQKVVDVADKQSKTLELDVKPLDDKTTTEGLISLYESFGFKKVKGSDTKMVREPQVKGEQKPKPKKQKKAEVAKKPKVEKGTVVKIGNLEYTVLNDGTGQKVFNSKGKTPSKPTTRKVLKKYAQNNYDFTKGERYQGKEEDRNEDYDMLIANNSKNPAELAEIALKTQTRQFIESKIPEDIQDAILAMLGNVKRGKVDDPGNDGSFINQGDVNYITNAIGRSYLKKNGMGLDVIAQDLLDNKFTPDELVTIIRDYPNGINDLEKEIRDQYSNPAKSKFTELTGFPASDFYLEEAVKQENKRLEQELELQENALSFLTEAELNELYQNSLDYEKSIIERSQRSDENADIKDGKKEPGVQKSSNVENKDSRQKEKITKQSDDAFLDWFDSTEKKLDDFGKENLGIGLPVVIAKETVKIVRAAYKAGKTAAQAIKEALDYIKATDWYKSLSKSEQKEINGDVVKQAVVQDNMTDKEGFDYVEKSFDNADKEYDNKNTTKGKLKKAVRKLIQKISDRQFISKKLVGEVGAQQTKDAMIVSHGASGRAKRIFEEAYNKIYTDKVSFKDENGKLRFRFEPLSSKDRKMLDKMIMLKRFIAIDKNREELGLPPVKHQDFISRDLAEKHLRHLKKTIGDKKYANLEKRTKAYFDVYKRLLQDMLDNSLINQETFDKLNGVDYQPRLFLQHVIDFDGNVSLGVASKEKSDTGGLSQKQIQELDEGSTGSLIRNSEWLLATSIDARQRAIAMNTVNKTFMTKEYPAAKKRFNKLKKDFKNRKKWSREDKRFYNYFKELNKKVIDNPIIGNEFSENKELSQKIEKELKKQQDIVKALESQTSLIPVETKKLNDAKNKISKLEDKINELKLKPVRLYDKVPNKNFKKAYYYVDGVRQEFFLESELHEDWFDNVSGAFSSGIKEIVGYFSGSSLLKGVATGNNPAFALVNAPRDFIFNTIFSDQYSTIFLKAVYQVAKDTFKAVNEIRKSNNDFTASDNLFDKYVFYGGDMAFLSTQGRLKKNTILAKAIDKIISPRVKNYGSKIFKTVTLRKISEYSEIMFRMALFQRTIKNQLKELGLKDISEVQDLKDKETGEIIDTKKERQDAIYRRAVAEARSLLDFNQGGTFAKDAEALIPYINTAIQGTRVAADAFHKHPEKVTAKILQAGVILSGATMGLSLALITMNKSDEDEDKSALEIYLHALEGISQYQRIQYMNIVDGTKDEDGNYRIWKVAKNQQLAPILTISDNIYIQYASKLTGTKRKSSSVNYTEAWTAIQNNIIPIDLESPLTGNVTKIPLVKAGLTYTTGYDFYRDQPLTFDTNINNPVMEGAQDKNVDDFYKKVGRKYRLSPARMKGFVESLITTPRTNPFVGVMYAGLDGVTSQDKSLKEIANNVAKDAYKSLDKRLVSKTSDFNRKVNRLRPIQGTLDKIRTANDYREVDIENVVKDFYQDKLSTPEFIEKIKDYSPKEQEKVESRIKSLLKYDKVDRFVIGLSFETDKEIRGFEMAQYYGDLFDGTEENNEILKQMFELNVLDAETLTEYNKYVEKVKNNEVN